MTGKEIQNWADDFMFTAEKSDAVAGPQAFLIAGTPDPLGSIAVAAEAYMGRFYESKDSITDDQRRYYLEQIQKTKLKMPMEAVSLHWRIKGVTRSFTHQMVRQRTAAYSQESMRFAVKEDAATAVALPPSLAVFNTAASTFDHETMGDELWDQYKDEYPNCPVPGDKLKRWYLEWRYATEVMARSYTNLVNDGMPAEDARGLTPHNIVTQLNYITNLRNYQDHAGNRLCTQAQFEWRIVWAKMLQAMRNHCSCPNGGYTTQFGVVGDHFLEGKCDNWQWKAISEIFLPVCYQMGKCQFEAEFDRKCSIRNRVNANAEVGRTAEQWEVEHVEPAEGIVVGVGPQSVVRSESGRPVFIGAIQPAEWLTDAAAAR